MNLLQRMRGNRADPVLSMDNWMQFNGHQYPLGVQFTMPGSPAQEIENNFEAYVAGIHSRNGTVAAAVTARSLLLSQIQFKFRNLSDGPQAQLFGTPALLPLEQFDAPLTRPRVLMRAEQHVSYSGNAYLYRPLGGRVRLLNPDRVQLIIASETDQDTPADQLDGELVAYLYRADKTGRSQVLAPSEVVQWAPEPHPLNPWIGQSWITSVMSEVMGDRQVTEHQTKFYANAATPNMVIKLPTSDQKVIEKFAAQFRETNSGAQGAGKTLMITDGADVQVVGAMLQQLELKDTQGGHESRIAARSQVPATVLGIREGLAGSALNAGNYSSARRMWADKWFSPTADGLCAAVAPLVEVPSDSELSYDPARVMFLQEDRKDEAEIGQKQAEAIKTFIDAGFDPMSARDAVTSGDLSKLNHTGLVSVQLQAPGADQGAPS